MRRSSARAGPIVPCELLIADCYPRANTTFIVGFRSKEQKLWTAKYAKDAKDEHGFAIIVDQTSEAVFQEHNVEVDKKPDGDVQQAEMG